MAQQNSLKGSVADTAEKKKLQHAIIALIDLADSTLYRSVRADVQGRFTMTKIPSGRYTVMISYPKMADFLQDITITDSSVIDLATVSMVSDAVLLEEVVVRANLAMRMRGDTLEYRADSFAVRKGANVEELLRRLPGIEVDSKGKIKAQGKNVNRILVDGDEFFSDDPVFATRFLRAEVVDKIQVFDKRSEEAEITGVDDGQRSRTINVSLKDDKKNGYFGRLTAGGDASDYYQYEGMVSLFTPRKKASVFASSSRVGAGTQSLGDLTRYVEEDTQVIEDGTSGMQVSRVGGFGSERAGGSGIPSVVVAGAHYSNKWQQNKQKLLANYRLNQTDIEGWNTSRQTTTLPDGTGFTNWSSRNSDAWSLGQQANATFQTPVDSIHTLKVVIKGNIGSNKSYSQAVDSSRNLLGYMVNNSNQYENSEGDNRNFGSSLSYYHRLGKKRGSLTFVFQQEYGLKDNDRYAFAANKYYDPATGAFLNADTLDQLQRSHDLAQTYAGKISWAKRIGRTGGVNINYGYKSISSGSDYNVWEEGAQKYNQRIDSLSNNYQFNSGTHILGGSLSRTINSWLTTSANVKLFLTDFKQLDRDRHELRKRNFVNFAPELRLGIGKAASRVDLTYAGSTQQPTLEQLQPLRRSSNPLLVQLGNPDLKPSFSHTGGVSFTSFNMSNGRFMMVSAGTSYISNAITAETSVDAQNRQTTRYINLNSVPGFNLMSTYGKRLQEKHLSVNLGANLSTNGNYLIQNGEKVRNNNINYGANGGFTKDWEDVCSVELNSRFNFTEGRSSVKNYSTRRNFTHSHSIRGYAHLPFKLELNTDCDMSFQPKNEVFKESLNVFRWNAYVQRTFLRNDELFLRFAVDDILNNNTGYTRTVSGNMIAESNSLVLKRYCMLSLTWNFARSL